MKWLLLLLMGLMGLTVVGCSSNQDESEKSEASSEDLSNQYSSETFTKVEITDPSAVCSDGTRAAFYFRKGIGEIRTDWTIYMNGGGSCHNDGECEKRWLEAEASNDWQHKMSSKNYVDTTEGLFTGILNLSQTQNPDFFSRNMVYLPYCSSDEYMGDRGLSEGAPWEFRGYRIVQAMFTQLKDTLGLSSASHVIFSGSSAGSQGMVQHLDWVAELLPNATVVGIKDAAFNPSFGSYFGIQQEQEYVYTVRYPYWGYKGDQTCMDNAATPEFCVESNFLYSEGYISTPYFVYLDLTDIKFRNALTDLKILTPANSAKILSEMADVHRADLQTFPHGCFSTNIGNHTALLDDDLFFNTTVNGQTYAQTLANWIYNRNQPQKIIQGL